ncbi:hypothetical protein F5Y14DRAFT_406368 [Nemania sp. NC0429]|nr:hypothetical protein F5Y14DRAFT_406368 [Nemania sp. NC0429]
MDLYSTLEVSSAQRHPANEHAQTYYPEPRQSRLDSAVPEVVPLEYKNDNIHAAGTEGELPRAGPSTSATNGQDTQRRCGLTLRSFYTILAILVVLAIGAIAGGVAGGIISSRRQNNSNSTEPGMGDDGGNLKNLTNPTNPTNPTTSRILSTSKLSATNWTDPRGNTHRFVFFQDASNAIIVRRWDAQNGTWGTNNLTDILRTSRAPINPLGPSTPLASASVSFNNTKNRVYLWYLAQDNTIASVEVQDLVDGPEDWRVNALSGAFIRTHPGSQLAAAWNRCWGPCAGNWVVAYQRPEDAAIQVANGSDLSHGSLAIDSDRVAVGSSLAITPEVQIDDTSVSRLTMISESLSTSDSGKAQKSTYITSWERDAGLLHNTTLPAPSPRLQFAITLLDNLRTIVFLALLPNGTVTGEYFRVTFVTIPSVEFRGGPSNLNFTAIATSEEAMFYGISQDEIHQYSVNDEDPSVFDYVEKVFP